MDEPRKPYHHGDLRRALLAAAEAILERDGLPALTLRAAAREAGVSHAAPAHHFGDLVGLLSELAAAGFTRFGDRLEAAADGTPDDALFAQGMAYIAFARDHPGLFTLMFRSERLDMQRPALRDAVQRTRQVFTAAVTGHQASRTLPQAPLAQLAAGIAPWALAHGLAMLMIDGRLAAQLARLPQDARDIDALLAAVLRGVRLPGE